jgi:aldose 1-epimerase
MDTDAVRIRAGEWEATFDPQGARLVTLRRDDTELVVPATGGRPEPWYRGALVAPWPNRIADGRYEWGGRQHQLPLNEVERRTALHGLASWERWTTTSTAPSGVTMSLGLTPRDGWPFHLDLQMAASLDPTGLRWELAATNRGDGVAPWGCTIHPYLRAPRGTADEWTLQVPADRVLEVTPDRLLPVGEADVTGTRFDLRDGAQLADRDLDHAFTGLAADVDGLARAHLLDPDGHGVTMTWSVDRCPWIQVFTGAPHRDGVAVEPMTCPPDAYNSRRDLVVLAPGTTTTTWWHLATAGPDRA